MVDVYGKAATGGSYSNKYLMGEGGCISGGGLVIFMCGYKCLHIYDEPFEKDFKLGKRSFSHSISHVGKSYFILLSASFSPSHLLSSSLLFFPPSISQSIPLKAE